MSGARPASIAVIDHGAGNLVSVANALLAVGAEVVVATKAHELEAADGIVLPGVGHTGAAMRNLRAEGLVEPIRELTKPLLGICVGLQLLFEGSDEDDEPCLGILPGRVERIPDAPTLPHMGWNPVTVTRPDPVFEGLPEGSPFYFVHSFVPVPADDNDTLATAEHGSRFCAAARRGSIVGTQFHPERSGRAGLTLLRNWVQSVLGSIDGDRATHVTPRREAVGGC